MLDIITFEDGVCADHIESVHRRRAGLGHETLGEMMGTQQDGRLRQGESVHTSAGRGVVMTTCHVSQLSFPVNDRRLEELELSRSVKQPRRRGS